MEIIVLPSLGSLWARAMINSKCQLWTRHTMSYNKSLLLLLLLILLLLTVSHLSFLIYVASFFCDTSASHLPSTLTSVSELFWTSPLRPGDAYLLLTTTLQPWIYLFSLSVLFLSSASPSNLAQGLENVDTLCMLLQWVTERMKGPWFWGMLPF